MCNAYCSSGMSADDSSRVVLSVPNTSGTDYINASFVNVSNAEDIVHSNMQTAIVIVFVLSSIIGLQEE